VQTVLALKLGLDAAGRGEDPVDLVREALEHAERATVELRDIVHGILPALAGPGRAAGRHRLAGRHLGDDHRRRHGGAAVGAAAG
jgi:hypothetical protein